MTDDEAFEEPDAQARCPACLAAVEPDQQYCLQCGERLAPAGPPPSSPLPGRTSPPAAAIIVGGALLLLIGGFGIAYGFTRERQPEGPRHRRQDRPPPRVPRCRRTLSVDTGQSVPTFTDVVTTGTFPPPTDTGTLPDTTPTGPTTATSPTDTQPPPNTDTDRGDERLAVRQGRLRGDPLLRRHREVHVRVDHGQEAAGDQRRLRQRAAC